MAAASAPRCTPWRGEGLEKATSGSSPSRPGGTPYFTGAERAALALAEAATRLADRPGPVPEEVWKGAAGYYAERPLPCLLIEIAAINAFNRLSVPARQPSGRM